MSDALTWCMSGEELDKYENAITAYCKNKGGEMTQSDFCLDASGQAIFMAKASILDRCYPATHKALVETKIIESTQPTPTPSYLRELSNYGFKSKTHLAAEEAYYQAMDLASQEKHQNDLPLITRIGTSVCTNQEGKIIYGWVEDYVEPNLKIRVYGWGTMHSHNILAYPSAKIIWTHHSNWNLCN